MFILQSQIGALVELGRMAFHQGRYRHGVVEDVFQWQLKSQLQLLKFSKRILTLDAFWEKLKSAAEGKVGAVEAERFCKAFQRIHSKLVHEELSLDAAWSLLNSS
ncbi:hypothetical protein SO802_018969 [Lithocarpus litseifolius]|uniref:Uncharacterized protein n=1 Tax=Lithocarpus litseifolius TaxID=425828 RepID=A0AAW2CMV3_9ROSI